MKNILILYITTGIYNNYAEQFFNSLSYFQPKDRKKVIWYTDDLINENKSFIKPWDTEVVPLRHYPWPIITLFKFNYLKEAINLFGSDYDYIFYFNANILFKDYVTNYANKDKLTAVYHWNWLNGNKNFVALGHGDYKSTSYIDHPYDYVQACQVGGDIKEVEKMCNTINYWIQLDLANNIIPRFHDESYYVKYIDMNKSIVNYRSELEYNVYLESGIEYKNPKIIMVDDPEVQQLKNQEYLKTI